MELRERLSTEYLELNSCGEQVMDHVAQRSDRKNGRVDYHILYIAAGHCYVLLDGVEHRASVGSVILFHPHEPLCYRFSEEERSVSLFLHFSGTGCQELLKQSGLVQPITEVGYSDSLIAIFSRLQEEYLLRRPFHSMACTGLLLQFLSLIGRKIAASEQQQSFYPEEKLQQVCQIMYREFANNRPISYYAELCHLSESRFSHAFKAYAGRAPKSYLTLLRVEHALRLLETTRLPMQEVAQQVGIEDFNYFSRLIKRHTGYPPGHFRNQR